MTTVVDAIASGGRGGSLTVLDAEGRAEELSWARVHLRARRVAAVLAGEGVGRGRRVGLLADTSVDLVSVLQAVWLTGGAVTVLPVGAGGHRDRDRVRAVAADAALDLVVVADPAVGALGAPVLPLADLVRRSAIAAPAPVIRPAPSDLAVLQYTSGSTRTPRGVPVSHAHLAANLDGIRLAAGHEADHPGPLLSWLPLYHDMGLIGGLALPMSCGCPLVLMSPVGFARRPAAWLAAIHRYRPTCTGGPTFAFGLLARILRAAPAADLRSLRHLVLGGEPVDPATMADFLAAAAPCGLDPAALAPAYGLAESTLAVTYSPRGQGLRVDRVDPVTLETAGVAVAAAGGRALARLGPPLPGVSLRIVDRATGAEVGERRVGHIEVRGPSVVGRYWGEPPPPAGAWLRTGDLGYLADGDLVVCGRAKDVVFAAGRNVYPSDVEAAAAEVPGVRWGGVAAFGVPAAGGDRLVVAVESVSRAPETVRRAVVDAVLDEVGLTPAAVLVLPPRRLPKTSSGKIRGAAARRLYQCGELS
ncbi:AMP-binding protein [Actinomycetes bacterium KLBMP 9797]